MYDNYIINVYIVYTVNMYGSDNDYTNKLL